MHYEDGEVIRADKVFVCFGMKTSDTAVSVAKSAQATKGQISVDASLRVRGSSTVFAAGDVMRDPSGELKQAFFAEGAAHIAAHNALAAAFGDVRDPKCYPHHFANAPAAPLVYIISLGRYDGSLGFNNKLVINGAIAAIMKYVLESTKVMQMEGRILGNAIWKVGDAVTLALNRTTFLGPQSASARKTD